MSPLALLALLALQEGAGPAPASAPGASAASALAPLRCERGQDRPPLYLPRDEELVFSGRIELGPVRATVGTVTMTSRVEPYDPGVLLPEDAVAEGAETGRITVHAEGGYLFYDLDSTIETQVLPQEWPRIACRQRQSGSESRRRETLIGLHEGKPTVSYRKDTKKGAPRGTRIWRPPTLREIPADALDMVGAVFLVRTMIEQDLPELQVPIVDKLRVWDMRVRRGDRQRMKLPAGTFDVVEIVLDPKPHPKDGSIDDEDVERFEGLFGIHGSIHLFVEVHTGVPVRIQGDVPIGPITLGVDVQLESHRGTPGEFRTISDKGE